MYGSNKKAPAMPAAKKPAAPKQKPKENRSTAVISRGYRKMGKA